MQERNFVLSLLLLLSERLACCGECMTVNFYSRRSRACSREILEAEALHIDPDDNNIQQSLFHLGKTGSDTVLAEPESSGMLPTVQVTLGHSTAIVLLTSGNPDLQTATLVTETGTSATTKTGETNDHETEGLHPVLIFGVPAALVLVLLVLLIFFIVRRRKQKQHKQEELGSENCKSPIFEEDTPSVMEIEMEELDKWMNSLKRNAECEYLPPVKEEKDLNANTSDCES